jgi:hypothetical protein
MKKLFVVTSQSVVYAESAERAINALMQFDGFDIFNLDSGEAVAKEMTSLDDLPAGWHALQCPVDADNTSPGSSEPWALYSIQDILKLQKQSAADSHNAAFLLRRITELENLVNTLIGKIES